jgi:hypothetical protein
VNVVAGEYLLAVKGRDVRGTDEIYSAFEATAGIPPDVEVELDPAAVRQGHDPQLEKTVQILLDDLQKHPLPERKKPAYPVYK